MQSAIVVNWSNVQKPRGARREAKCKLSSREAVQESKREDDDAGDNDDDSDGSASRSEKWAGVTY